MNIELYPLYIKLNILLTCNLKLKFYKNKSQAYKDINDYIKNLIKERRAEIKALVNIKKEYMTLKKEANKEHKYFYIEKINEFKALLLSKRANLKIFIINIKAAFKLLKDNTKNIKLTKIVVSKKNNDNVVFNVPKKKNTDIVIPLINKSIIDTLPYNNNNLDFNSSNNNININYEDTNNINISVYDEACAPNDNINNFVNDSKDNKNISVVDEIYPYPIYSEEEVEIMQKNFNNCLKELEYIENIVDRPLTKNDQRAQNLIDHMPNITFKEIKNIISSYETNKKITYQQYKSLFFYYDYHLMDYYIILIRAKEYQIFRDDENKDYLNKKLFMDEEKEEDIKDAYRRTKILFNEDVILTAFKAIDILRTNKIRMRNFYKRNNHFLKLEKEVYDILNWYLNDFIPCYYVPNIFDLRIKPYFLW